MRKTSGDAGPRKVAMVFIDSHGDFNTPETTLSGMLGGMPVAVSAGMALHNLRRESGLDPGIPTANIVMGAVVIVCATLGLRGLMGAATKALEVVSGSG